MNETKIQETLEYLVNHLKELPMKRDSFESVVHNLAKRLELQNQDDTEAFARKTISYALYEWIIDKVIDYPSFDGPVPLGELRWFLKLLSAEEKENLQRLPPHEQELTRILHECQSDEEIGTIREDIAIQKLRDRGFPVKRVHLIKDKVGDTFIDEDERLVRFVYLIPEYELTDEYKARRERHEKEVAKRERLAMDLNE